MDKYDVMLQAEIEADDDKVREKLSICPDCDGRGYRRVYRQLSSFERWYTPCPTCSGSQEGSRGQEGGGVC